MTSGITQEELIGWGGAEVFNQALQCVNHGDVVEAVYDDEKLEMRGKIAQPSGWDMPVSFQLKPNNCILSRCPCDTNRRYGKVCFHVVAVGLAVMCKEMDEAEEERRKVKVEGQGQGVDAEAVEEEHWIEVEMKPKIAAYLKGSRASLGIDIDVRYGNEIEFPACSVQSDRTVWLEDPDDPLVRRVRSMASERAAIEEIENIGFGLNGSKELHYTMVGEQNVLNFLGAGIPALTRRGWAIELSPGMEKLTEEMPSVLPIVEVRDAPGGAFDVAYRFDAMGEEVSPVLIQAALSRGDGYLRMEDGHCVLLDNKAIEAMHAIFRDCAKTQGGAPAGWFRVNRIHAQYVRSSLEALDFEIDDDAAEKWREESKARTVNGEAKYEPVALGKLESVLRPYQKQGVYWMNFLEEAGFCGLLADEMGLGKTLQTLTWISLHRSTPQPPTLNPQLLNSSTSQLLGTSLIVCPTSLVRNWEAEAEKFTPWLRVLVMSGPNRAEFFDRFGEYDLVITSYNLLQRDVEDGYFGREFAAIVLDEAQRIKNRGTRNAKAVKLLRSRRRLVLTGTPIENSVADVWSIFDFLMPDYLENYDSFKAMYQDPIAAGGAAAEEAQARLRRKLAPFILRREKKTVAKDLPDKIVKVSYCPMNEDAQREYNEALAKTRKEAGGMVKAKGLEKSRFAILAMLMKLRQIASKAKLEPFLDQLESAIESGRKILVFSQFVGRLQDMANALEERGVKFCYLDGATKDRMGEVNRFNRSPEIRVFLISLMAGGTGLNLTSADTVIHYDPWWNPAVEDQATDRAHRIGQKKSVYVMKMIASDTIEEKVLDLQRRKQAVISATVSTSDEAVMSRLSVADIAALLQ